MKRRSSLIQNALILFISCLSTQLSAQCELFKSEIADVKNYIDEVSHFSDSMQTYAESAAFAAKFSEAKTDARKVEVLAGEALAAAYEAVKLASEAQYYSEICGIDAVVSFSIDAESLSIDARDYADEAFTNAKKANTARNLGDIRFFMRKSLEAGKEARKSAEAAAYAASDAHYSCTHSDLTASGQN
jgi:hypothetical protein